MPAEPGDSPEPEPQRPRPPPIPTLVPPKVSKISPRERTIVIMNSRRGNDINFDDDSSTSKEARGGRRRRTRGNDDEGSRTKKTASEINWGDTATDEGKNAASDEGSSGRGSKGRRNRSRDRDRDEDPSATEGKSNSPPRAKPSNGWGSASTEGKSSDSGKSTQRTFPFQLKNDKKVIVSARCERRQQILQKTRGKPLFLKP